MMKKWFYTYNHKRPYVKRLLVIGVVIGLVAASGLALLLLSPSSTPALFTYQTDLDTEGYFYYGSPAMDDQYVYIGTSVKWHHLADGASQIPNSFQLICLDKSDGHLVWRHDLGRAEVQNGPMLLDGKVIISVGYYNASNYHTNATVMAFNASSGQPLWETQVVASVPTNYSIDGGPWDQQSNAAFLFQGLATDGSDTLLVGGDKLRSLHPDNGSLLWEADLGENINFIVMDGQSAYACSRGHIYKVYVDNGSRDWDLQYQNGSQWHIGFQCVVLPDHSVLVGLSGYLWRLNSDGSLNWSFDTGGLDIRAQPAVDSLGNIYVGTKANEQSVFFKIDSEGQEVWRVNVGADMYSSPVLGDDGKVYVGSENGPDVRCGIHVFDVDTGDLLQKFDTEADLIWFSPIISDGILYVGDMRGVFYAFSVSSSEMDPNAMWPCRDNGPMRQAKTS